MSHHPLGRHLFKLYHLRKLYRSIWLSVCGDKSVFGVERKFVDVALLYVDTTEEVIVYEKAYEIDMMCLTSLIFVTVLGNKKLSRLWNDFHRLIMELANEVDFKKMDQDKLDSIRDKIERSLALLKWQRR
ncbi:hypothetical protein OROHE_010893 [Orobanche hederae]